MRNTLLAALTALLLAASPAGQAAVRTYSLHGTMDSGHLAGQVLTGDISFDDASLTATGFEIIGVNSLSISFFGHTWTLGQAAAAPDVSFADGVFLGLSFSAGADDVSLALIPGFSGIGEAFAAYDTPLGLSGAGNLVYAPVPEPAPASLLLAGLGLLGVLAGRRMKLA